MKSCSPEKSSSNNQQGNGVCPTNIRYTINEVEELIKDLTPEEKTKQYSKYFYRPIVPPASERLAVIDKPMDPSKALPIEQINDLLNRGYHEVESGWCILPNGAGYVANHTPMPGVTVDMINWWMAWHGLESLRYKLWYRPAHFEVSLSDKDRAKVLDPGRSLAQKNYGVTHFVIEDIGGGSAEKIAISFMSPEEVGFDMSRFKSPNVGTIVAANGVSQLINPPPGVPNIKSPAFMLHFIREVSEGIEYRTRFWIGYHIVDRIPNLLLPKGVKLPDFVPTDLARHNVQEYTHLASFLPEIYGEQKGIVS